MNETDYSFISRRWASEWARYAKRENLGRPHATVRGMDIGDGKGMMPQLLVSMPYVKHIEWFLAGEKVLLNGNSYLELAGMDPEDPPYSNDCQFMLFSWEITP